jgi:hypothetical protein
MELKLADLHESFTVAGSSCKGQVSIWNAGVTHQQRAEDPVVDGRWSSFIYPGASSEVPRCRSTHRFSLIPGGHASRALNDEAHTRLLKRRIAWTALQYLGGRVPWH